ncbi:MAG: polysulfide reductase NrfD [Candidatus Hydrogenedentes bacterium]|nr:polysulfide reductase NrfD [Candidatus Hydrogenedentota bacterium]
MAPESLGYSFPNDLHIMWSLMIVMYPYITGLVAGAFIVSSLYHVFGRNELRPVSRLSMVASFSFLTMAPVPLLLHLGHPERCFNIMVTPHFTSAMAAFGLIYALYLTLVLVEIWLVYRKDIILTAARSRGLKRVIFKVLALGVYDMSDDALRIDRKVIVTLAAIGIPAACILHGYVGFMFGSVKANHWWSTPLMPIIFLFSAVTSGIAMVIVLYMVISRLNQRIIDGECVQALSRWLWLFTILTVTIEQLEIVTLAYKQGEEWPIIATLLSDKLAFPFLVVQTVIGSMIPIILFGIVVLMRPFLTDPLRNTIAFVASIILLLQVFSMRWNVVIGGQIFSKSLRGFRESYVPELFGQEGIAAAIIVFIVPFVVMAVFNRYLPLHADQKEGGRGMPANVS